MTNDYNDDNVSWHDDRRGPPRDRDDRWDDHKDYYDQGQAPPPIDDHRHPKPPHGAPPQDDYGSGPHEDDYYRDRRLPQDDYDRDRRPPRDDYDRDRRPPRDEYDRDRRPPRDDYDRDRRPPRDDYDSDRRPPQNEYDRDRRPPRDDYDRDRRLPQDDYDRDRRPPRDEYDRDRRPPQDDYDRNRRPPRDEYDRDRRPSPTRPPPEGYLQQSAQPPGQQQPYIEQPYQQADSAQQPAQPQVPTPKPKPNAGGRVGGLFLGVFFIIILLMLLGIMPRPYILFDEDDPTFGKEFSLFGDGFGGDDSDKGIPSDLVGTWRTTGATLTFSASGSGNLRMDDGFYIGFTYRVVDKARIYYTYSGGTEEEDYSKIITMTSTTLTLQATDVSEGNYMGATTTYTKQ